MVNIVLIHVTINALVLCVCVDLWGSRNDLCTYLHLWSNYGDFELKHHDLFVALRLNKHGNKHGLFVSASGALALSPHLQRAVHRAGTVLLQRTVTILYYLTVRLLTPGVFVESCAAGEQTVMRAAMRILKEIWKHRKNLLQHHCSFFSLPDCSSSSMSLSRSSGSPKSCRRGGGSAPPRHTWCAHVRTSSNRTSRRTHHGP